MLSTFLLVLLCLDQATSAGIQCLGQGGKPVDWFIVYKMPRLRHKTTTSIGDGLAMFYLDGGQPQWTLLTQAINESGHPIYYTLEQVYSAKSDSILHMMFNDERPDKTISLNHGHAKGVVGFDLKSGFWLIHSAPKFPPEQSKGYEWADNASDYGQMFMCVSFPYKALGVLAKQLLFYYPEIYDLNFPPTMVQDFPALALLANNTKMKNPPFHSVAEVQSLAGVTFVSFAKFTLFGADLYDALVAPYFNTSLDVETWQNGKGDLASNCSVPCQNSLYSTCHLEVHNILDVQLPKNVTFDDHKDHSKYAVSTSSALPWVCVGGINRQDTQFKRGGGTLCLKDQNVWSTFNNMVVKVQDCVKP